MGRLIACPHNYAFATSIKLFQSEPALLTKVDQLLEAVLTKPFQLSRPAETKAFHLTAEEFAKLYRAIDHEVSEGCAGGRDKRAETNSRVDHEIGKARGSIDEVETTGNAFHFANI